jgi:hypothetical protein
MGKYDAAPTPAAGLIRLARDKAGLTQSQLADRAGVNQQVVSAYETGRREPTLPMLAKLVAAAGYEMRIALSPFDDHDATVESFLAALPPEHRAEVERQARERAAAAGLRRVRDH